MTTISGIAHVSLTVRNLRISEAWYRRVLGFERVLEDQTAQFHEVLMLHRESGAMIGLRQHHVGVTARFDESRTGLDHLALAVPDAVALVDWRKRLRELGVVSSELVQHRTGTVLILRDPDHIQVELHCPAPATVWADPAGSAAPTQAGRGATQGSGPAPAPAAAGPKDRAAPTATVGNVAPAPASGSPSANKAPAAPDSKRPSTPPDGAPAGSASPSDNTSPGGPTGEESGTGAAFRIRQPAR